MRDKYVGDISDYIKYALLRALSEVRGPLGVAWYYNTTPCNRPDGRHREYLEDERWRELDPDLFDALKGLPESAGLKDVETFRILPEDARFHHEPMPESSDREDWATGMLCKVKDCPLVFLDPDNGVGNADVQHATFDEIRRLRQTGVRATVLIKFPGRENFDEQERRYHQQLQESTGALNVRTFRTSVMVPGKRRNWVPRCRWFTVLDYDASVAERFVKFEANWDALRDGFRKRRRTRLRT